MKLNKWLEGISPQFEAGGKYEKLYPVYEAFATIFYSVDTENHGFTRG